MELEFEIKPYGVGGALLSFGKEINIETHKKVKIVYNGLRNYSKSGIKSLIPSYCEITVQFEPNLLNSHKLEHHNMDNLQSVVHFCTIHFYHIHVCFQPFQ